MTRLFSYSSLFIITTVLLIGCGTKAPENSVKTFGLKPTMTEVVDLATVQAQPADYVNKEVLVVGNIVDMCRHSGCWVEIQAADSNRILCRSLDESVQFSQDCLGKPIRLQGVLMYDPDAPGQVEKAHEGEEPHACPAPPVLVSIKGAEVGLATVN